MRGIIFKAKHFSSKDIKKSTWPEKIAKYATFDKALEEFRDVINVWICIEKGDKEEYTDALFQRIRELNNQFYHLKHIIVLPFGHLSHNLASPKDAKTILIKLTMRLRRNGFHVDRMSFGTHKDFLIEVPGHPGSTSYFEFPYPGKKPKT